MNLQLRGGSGFSPVTRHSQNFYDTYPDRLSGGLPEGEDLAWLGTFMSARVHEAFLGALEALMLRIKDAFSRGQLTREAHQTAVTVPSQLGLA